MANQPPTTVHITSPVRDMERDAALLNAIATLRAARPDDWTFLNRVVFQDLRTAEISRLIHGMEHMCGQRATPLP